MRGTKPFRNGKQVDKVSTCGVMKGIDGLCSLVQEHYGKELRTHDLFYSVAGGQIGSKGAEASAILYSLVETAKETGVDPYTYFVYTLTEAANLREAGENDKISKFTPAHFKQQMQIPSNRPQV